MNVWCVTSAVHLRELLLGRELTVEQEVRDLEIGRLLRELLDRVAAVAQDAGVAVEEGDRAGTRRRRQERRVVHAQIRVELAQRRRREHAVVDVDRDLFAGAVVDDGDGVSHPRSPLDSSSPQRTYRGELSCLRPTRRLLLAVQHREGLCDLRTGVDGLDHRVDVPPFRCDERVEEALLVFGLELGPLVGRCPAVQDLDRAFRSHDRELGGRPGEAQVVPHLLRVHDDVRAAV